MTGTLAAVIALIVLLVLIAMQVPIAFALSGSALVGMLLMRGTGIATVSLSSLPYVSTATYVLTVIPMYVLLGVMALHGRLGDELFRLAESAFRRVPGGLGLATIAASAGFGAVSGSTAAAAVAMGKLTIPRMLRNGYTKPFASGIASVGGTLDVLIPPSVIMVMYAVIAQVPTGAMLIAGLLPALVTAAIYSAYVWIRSLSRWRNRVILPVAGADSQASRGFPIGGLLRAVLLFGVVIGGIYTGIFTPTEAGAIGALLALVMLALDFRGHGARRFGKVLWASLSETAAMTSMILAIIVGAALFSSMLAMTGVPRQLAAFLAGLDMSPTMFMLVVILMLLPLGMFLEGMSILTIVVPFLVPVMAAIGVDPIWAGVLILKAIAVGMVTPPVGIIPFIVAGAVKEVSVGDIFRGIVPFVLVDLGVIALLVLVPDISTVLPNLMK